MADPNSAGSIRPLRIFIVEDDSETQKAYRLFFEVLGHSVNSSFSVAHARERLAAQPFDLLIVDIGLPDGDGWELLAGVELFQPLYAIAITARDTTMDRAKSASVGFHRHLAKPWHVAELDDVLRDAAAFVH